MRIVRLLTYGLVVVVGLYLLAAVLYAIPVVSGALDDTMEVKFSRTDPSIASDYGNGLTPGQKEAFYHLSQGAEILPWTLLTAVESTSPILTPPSRSSRTSSATACCPTRHATTGCPWA